MLTERGLTPEAAGFATSLYILAATAGVPLGGWLADRTGRPHLIVLVSMAAGAALFPSLLHLPIPVLLAALVIGGLLVGLAPGPVVAMPGRILPAQARAFGTGVFYAIYYLQMLIMPPLAGATADRTGDVGSAFLLGGGMMALGIVAHAAYIRTAAASQAARI